MSSIEVFSRRWTASKLAGAPGGASRHRGRAPRRTPEAGGQARSRMPHRPLPCSWRARGGSSNCKCARQESAAGWRLSLRPTHSSFRTTIHLLQEFDLAGLVWPVELTQPTRFGARASANSWAYLRFACEPQSSRADEIADSLLRFQSRQPGLAHPISDQYAVSVIPLFLTLLAVESAKQRARCGGATGAEQRISTCGQESCTEENWNL